MLSFWNDLKSSFNPIRCRSPLLATNFQQDLQNPEKVGFKGTEVGIISSNPSIKVLTYIWKDAFIIFGPKKALLYKKILGPWKYPPTPICIFQTLCQIGLIEQIISPSSYYFQLFCIKVWFHYKLLEKLFDWTLLQNTSKIKSGNFVKLLKIWVSKFWISYQSQNLSWLKSIKWNVR